MGIFGFLSGRKKGGLAVDNKNIVTENYAPLTIHDDLRGLLWFADGSMKNYPPENLSDCDMVVYGQTVSFRSSIGSEPSLIYTSKPISHGADIHSVPRPPYSPTYTGLTPEQRGVYVSLLADPYNADIDIGFVFLLYYGLERHLLHGEWERAVYVIKKLREVHKNGSFQSYSAVALNFVAVWRNRRDIADGVEFNDYHLRLLDSYYRRVPLTPDEIMSFASDYGFTNKNYIKKETALFRNTLEEKIRERYGTGFMIMSDIISEDEISELEIHIIPAFANVTLQNITTGFPHLNEHPKVQSAVHSLLADTHESVKRQLAQERKRKTT